MCRLYFSFGVVFKIHNIFIVIWKTFKTEHTKHVTKATPKPVNGDICEK